MLPGRPWDCLVDPLGCRDISLTRLCLEGFLLNFLKERVNEPGQPDSPGYAAAQTAQIHLLLVFFQPIPPAPQRRPNSSSFSIFPADSPSAAAQLQIPSVRAQKLKTQNWKLTNLKLKLKTQNWKLKTKHSKLKTENSTIETHNLNSNQKLKT